MTKQDLISELESKVGSEFKPVIEGLLSSLSEIKSTIPHDEFIIIPKKQSTNLLDIVLYCYGIDE